MWNLKLKTELEIQVTEGPAIYNPKFEEEIQINSKLQQLDCYN